MHYSTVHKCLVTNSSGKRHQQESLLKMSKYHVLAMTLPYSEIHRHLVYVHCVAMSTTDRLRCCFSTTSPSRSFSTLQHAIKPQNIRYTNTSVCEPSLAPCMHACMHARPAHTLTHTSHEISKLGCTTKGKAFRPPANLMHADHFQNGTKWWTISWWLSGSLQGPRGGMPCNCVRVPPE